MGNYFAYVFERKIAGGNGENLAWVALTKQGYLPYDMERIYVPVKKI